jgi:hypothetical protein
MSHLHATALFAFLMSRTNLDNGHDLPVCVQTFSGYRSYGNASDDTSSK